MSDENNKLKSTIFDKENLSIYMSKSLRKYLKETCESLTGKDAEDIKNPTEFLKALVSKAEETTQYVDTPETLKKLKESEENNKDLDKMYSDYQEIIKTSEKSILQQEKLNKLLKEENEKLKDENKAVKEFSTDMKKEFLEFESKIKDLTLELEELNNSNSDNETEKAAQLEELKLDKETLHNEIEKLNTAMQSSQLAPNQHIIIINKFKFNTLEQYFKNSESLKLISDMNQEDGKMTGCFEKLDNPGKAQNFFDYLFSYVIRSDVYRAFKPKQVISTKQLTSAFNDYLNSKDNE